MIYVIEKGVPLPTRAFESVYPFSQMEIGDSFAVPVPINRKAESIRACVTQAASKFAKAQQKRDTWRFVSAIERKKGGEQAVRVWRALPKHRRTFPEAKASAELAASLAPVPVAPRVRRQTPKLDDDERATSVKATFAHEIPKFADGGKPRAVKGSRY